MNIYVETNFVFELVFQQEQSASCEEILEYCTSREGQLILPAYSLAEPHEKLSRQARSRSELQQSLDKELQQLARTAPYAERIQSIQDLQRLLVQSNEEEQDRFEKCRDRLIRAAQIIPLSSQILTDAASFEKPYALKPQDALVYVSVISHLRSSKPDTACFLNRNSKDFDNPDIVDELDRHNCRMIPRFDHGWAYIQSCGTNS